MALDRDVVVAHVLKPGHDVTAAVEARDARGGADREVDGASGEVEVLGDLDARHEAVRLGAAVGEAGQPALAVRRHQAEGVPALLAPGGGDAVALEHEVLDAPPAEHVDSASPACPPPTITTGTWPLT